MLSRTQRNHLIDRKISGNQLRRRVCNTKRLKPGKFNGQRHGQTVDVHLTIRLIANIQSITVQIFSGILIDPLFEFINITSCNRQARRQFVASVSCQQIAAICQSIHKIHSLNASARALPHVVQTCITARCSVKRDQHRRQSEFFRDPGRHDTDNALLPGIILQNDHSVIDKVMLLLNDLIGLLGNSVFFDLALCIDRAKLFCSLLGHFGIFLKQKLNSLDCTADSAGCIDTRCNSVSDKSGCDLLFLWRLILSGVWIIRGRFDQCVQTASLCIFNSRKTDRNYVSVFVYDRHNVCNRTYRRQIDIISANRFNSFLGLNSASSAFIDLISTYQLKYHTYACQLLEGIRAIRSVRIDNSACIGQNGSTLMVIRNHHINP